MTINNIDPNKVLALLRDAIGRHTSTPEEEKKRTDELHDAARSLDIWLSNGGELPEQWCQAKNAIRKQTRKDIVANFRKGAEEVRSFNRGTAYTLNDLADQIERGDL